ncbi:polysaccharide deacetylase family protein [Streptomyces sp. NPDC088387]|uniref:polysaccharide deacetylase family protein n=1 Tax=Streptomyces sp. NPDC088387 TaxID=3365859 RepID=UPI0037FD23B4
MRPRLLLTALLLLTVSAGCGRTGGPAGWVRTDDGPGAAHGAGSGTPTPDNGPPHRRWGLPAPLSAPPAGPARPTSLPRVVDHIPTRDKVVFLTYDDGAERDPRFVDLVRELRLPVSLFLTDSVAGPGYGHFARLRSVGASIQNHTLDHAALRGLPYAGQRAEICGQQNKLRSRFGIRPHLLRPPYGMYDDTTLRAAADCGTPTLTLWRATATDTDTHYTRPPHRLTPGDIISVTPDETTGPTLVTRTTRLLREIQQAGLTVANLDDYL